jgi:hypothetical protein
LNPNTTPIPPIPPEGWPAPPVYTAQADVTDWRKKYLAVERFVSGLVAERRVYMQILIDLLQCLSDERYAHCRCTEDADVRSPYTAARDLVKRWYASGQATSAPPPPPPPPLNTPGAVLLPAGQ